MHTSVFQRFIGAIGLSIGLVVPCHAQDTPHLVPGVYDVSVRLELPHMQSMPATKSVAVCVSPERTHATLGLIVLSENNPFTDCPVSKVHLSRNALTFDIVCPGGNAATATAKYRFDGERFSGRITMKMGGKNMTMTETQTGQRMKACQ